MFAPNTFAASADAAGSGPGHGRTVGEPAQSFGAPLVGLTVVVNAPPTGHRPRVVAACAVQLCVSTSVVPSGKKSRAESTLPRPNPKVASSRTKKRPGAMTVLAGIVYVCELSSSRKIH